MELVQGTPCENAIRRAMQMARDITSGQLAPIAGAIAIANLGTADCYDYLQAGVDVVDEMAGFTAFVDDWELRQDSEAVRTEISQEIREAARTFSEQFV